MVLKYIDFFLLFRTECIWLQNLRLMLSNEAPLKEKKKMLKETHRIYRNRLGGGCLRHGKNDVRFD